MVLIMSIRQVQTHQCRWKQGETRTVNKVLLLFNLSVMSNSLWPHGLQHAMPPCPSPSPRVYSNPCPLSRWCHPTISFSVISFSSCLRSFPASGSFPVSQLFASGGQSIGASASASVLPMNIQGWFPLGLTCCISLLSKGLSRVLQHHSLKASVLQCSAFFVVQLSHQCMTTGKTTVLTLLAKSCVYFISICHSFLSRTKPEDREIEMKRRRTLGFSLSYLSLIDGEEEEEAICHLPWLQSVSSHS